MIYVGSTYEELETRLGWHKTNKKSLVFRYKDHIPEIKLIVNMPCKDKKELEKIETEYIKLYLEKKGKSIV